ncbi:unnamed protein product [Choristocarpus tenellus]
MFCTVARRLPEMGEHSTSGSVWLLVEILHGGHDVLLRGWPEKHIPLLMYFVNLHKGSDYLDCFLLWGVLVKLELREDIISIFRQFYYKMRAWAHMGDGKCTDFFEVGQGL